MRTSALILLACVFGGAGVAQAACEANGIMLFPRPGAVIPTNSQLILEGRGVEAERVSALVGKTLSIRSASGETVTVNVRRGWSSDQKRVAVRLVPKKLEANQKYTLLLDEALPGWHQLDERAAQAPFWWTGAGPDHVRPKWDKLPAPAEGRYSVDDGRVTSQVKLNIGLAEESPAYVVVTLRRGRGSAHRQTYFAPLDGTAAVIGQDGCSGNFIFEDGRAYFAKVEAWDAAGNRAPPAREIEFHAPRAP